jgi:hypothetical protein
MQPATSLLPAATIPVPPRTVVMSVKTHSWKGEKLEAPFWHILGYRDHYEYNRRWFNQADVVLGDQNDGIHILDVTTLGLDPTECMAYLDAEERYSDLCIEEDRYNLHSDPDGKCLCGQIADQKAIMELYESKIDAAVLEHFDAWTRRRHLVALGVALGFTDFDRPAWLARLGLAPEPETEAPTAAGAAFTATVPAVEPVAVDWTI